MKELEKTYNPADIEDRLYQKWLDSKYFHADAERGRRNGKKPFTIVMPPPNITGQLHMGHALDNTMQDILIRYKRMQGYEALWQPGTDHAAIATEVKVINKLKEQGIDKHDLGREGFLEKAWEWKEEYGSRIVKQLHKLGSSADWDRERFTMDEGCSEAVLEVFTRLYEKGYIYKGSRIINWCPVCQTSISDAEVEHEEQDGFFWHINYPIVGEEGRFVEIATTRPETLLGDTAVAVNPEDERYKDIVGKMLKLPLTDREIPVIADEYVDKEFGTGCVKITPAHDPNDFEVGKRHNLEEICIMNDDATISVPGKYQGMDRYEARKAMVEDLKEMGLLVKVVPHSHNVGTHDRCGTTVEPMVKPQWFVKMEEMAKPAVEALKSGRLKFVPESFGKTYLHWLEGIRDWCISRQLWWGHRIPAYYCDDCGEMTVAKNAPAVCPKCGGTGNIYYYAHVEGGVCFLCGGSGVHPTQVIVRRAEYQRELDAKRLERARKAAPAVNVAFLEREGFSKDGKTYIVLGDTYAIREDLKAAGAKFSYNLGWHFPEPNPNYATREITKDTIVFQNDEETVTVLRELPNGMLDWPYDVYYLQEYVKRLQEEYKASLMPETKFFGELGQKVELTLALDRRSFFDTQWGSTAIYAFTDAEGHHFIWKTASWPDALTKVNEGDSIVLKGTIKEHNEYKGCKQTVLTRCKIVA